MMNKSFGRPAVSPPIVLGALIINHKEKLGDIDVVETIKENPYMQFFIGLKEFNPYPVFDPSLFVEIRKRVGDEAYDSLTVELIKAVSRQEDKKYNEKKDDDQELALPNKGKLKADATVADQYIAYPTDNRILNQSRKKLEGLIDQLYLLNGKKGTKPRTYRRKLDDACLDYSKKKKKSNATHRKMNRKLLEGVRRDIAHINKFLDGFEEQKWPSPLTPAQRRMFWIINTVYDQQKQMFDTKTHSCPDRIASIFQPHVRPIPRGKTKAQIEFGSKLGVSLDRGFARTWPNTSPVAGLVTSIPPESAEIHSPLTYAAGRKRLASVRDGMGTPFLNEDAEVRWLGRKGTKGSARPRNTARDATVDGAGRRWTVPLRPDPFSRPNGPSGGVKHEPFLHQDRVEIDPGNPPLPGSEPFLQPGMGEIGHGTPEHVPPGGGPALGTTARSGQQRQQQPGNQPDSERQHRNFKVKEMSGGGTSDPHIPPAPGTKGDGIEKSHTATSGDVRIGAFPIRTSVNWFYLPAGTEARKNRPAPETAYRPTAAGTSSVSPRSKVSSVPAPGTASRDPSSIPNRISTLSTRRSAGESVGETSVNRNSSAGVS